MTVNAAKKKLHKYGKEGNWRFKGLMLAALDRDVTAEDVAKAWPGRNKGDYRFLAEHPNRDIEMEMQRTAVAEPGEERHRLLHDYAVDADVPKRLSATSGGIEEKGEAIEARVDDAIPRMLFASSSNEQVNTLFREQLLETVMEGAERRKIAQDAATVHNVETRSGDVPVASDEVYAPAVAQGGEIRDESEQYATVSWDCTKYAQGSRVTDEEVDQAMVDEIERKIQKVGAAVQNSINRDFLNTLVDEANGAHTAADGAGYQALNEAYGVVDEEDFIPNTYVTHPAFRTALAADTNLAYANRAGTADVLENREEASLFGDIANLDTHAGASSKTYDSGTETWDYSATGETGAVVYDDSHLHLFLYSANGEGMEIKDYEDPVRDLQGVNARQYVDTDYSQERAAARVEY
jgi:hypothetical protein